MPCYCDIPDEEDQVTIEKRAKTRMYFDSQNILTPEQIDEANRVRLNLLPIGDINEHLCKICKILTEEQMKSISAYYFQIKWPHKTLYDWHEKHKEDDRQYNKD